MGNVVGTNRHLSGEPRFFEIVGPSGAGKSTVSEIVDASSSRVRAGMTVWGLDAGTLAAGTLASLPPLLRLIQGDLRVTVSDLKQVIRISAFFRVLERERLSRSYDTLLFDEGLIFALAKLRADGRSELFDSAVPNWEAQVLDRCAGVLDTVIWMDGSDSTLIDRIRSREKKHRMKMRPKSEIVEFLKRYRGAYESVIKELCRRGDVRVISFCTDSGDAESLSRTILALSKPRPDIVSKESAGVDVHIN